MSVNKYFLKKLHDQMRLIDIIQKKPKKMVRLDPIDPQDLNVEIDVIQTWSRNNFQLLQLILQNGMAQFICNYEFIYEHYEQLLFIKRNIKQIDFQTLRFTNLITLNLSQNQVQKIQNLPINLKQLYLDFNQLDSIDLGKKLKNHENLILLSVSHNNFEDKSIQKIVKTFPNLRCLNISSNKISDIRKFIQNIKKLDKLKILYTIYNPISLLKIYYQFITKNLDLRSFDNQKYIKQEPPKKQPPPKVQIKQQPKDEKKDAKKDSKKGAKQPEKVIQQVKPVVIEIQKPKQLTEEDFTKCKLKLSITNLENFQGNLYDQSIFGSQILDPRNIQSTYWISCSYLGNEQDLYEKRIKYDQATIIQNQQPRLSFSIQLQKTIDINQQKQKIFQNGIIIKVHKEQPLIQTNNETGQQKPILEDNQVKMIKQTIGGVFVDLRTLYTNKSKIIQQKFKLWNEEIYNRPFFKDRSIDQENQINKRKAQFQENLKKIQDEKLKKLQEQEASKAQKKGGKQVKKGADKKPQAKKDSKQVVSDKKVIQKSLFPLQPRVYSYLSDKILHKCRKQTLSLKVQIN